MYAGTNKGGTEAIVAAERLVRERRSRLDSALTTESVIESFPLAIDRIMGEGGLWDQETAAAAYLQANGDITEAVHLIRAHRSTLPRLAYSIPLDPREVQLLRRVVSTQRKPDGPMILGETVDYTARILHDGDDMPLPIVDEEDDLETLEHPADGPFRRFRDYLSDKGVLVDRTTADDEPVDIQLTAPQLPAHRSAWLSSISQADTGGLINIWYQSVIGTDGYETEDVTLGEVRHGRVPARVEHPHTGEPVEIGRVRVSECEAVAPMGMLRGEDSATFDVGYSMALGHNERKVIAGASLDIAAHRFRGTPDGKRLEQILLHTTDGLSGSGFLEHLKLPHYVTFQSLLDAAMAAQEEDAQMQDAPNLDAQAQDAQAQDAPDQDAQAQDTDLGRVSGEGDEA